MNKKQLIKKIIEENQQNLSFEHYYHKIKNQIELPQEKSANRSKLRLLIKPRFLTYSLLIFMLLLSVWFMMDLLHWLPFKNLDTITQPDESLQLGVSYPFLDEYFEQKEANYLKEPLRNLLIDYYDISLYIGYDEQHYFVIALMTDLSVKNKHYIVEKGNVLMGEVAILFDYQLDLVLKKGKFKLESIHDIDSNNPKYMSTFIFDLDLFQTFASLQKQPKVGEL